jgi:hypothetical protein
MSLDLTYRFKKPILVRGYSLKTANDGHEHDPKDWTIECNNVADNQPTLLHTVEGDEPRDRLAEKEYRIDADGDIWTDRITMKITDTKQSTGIV